MAKRNQTAKPTPQADDDIFAGMDGDGNDIFREDEVSPPPKTKDGKRRKPNAAGSTYGAPETALLPPPDRISFGRVLGAWIGGLLAFLLIGLVVALGLRFAGVTGVAADEAGTPDAEIAQMADAGEAGADSQAALTAPDGADPAIIAAVPTLEPTAGPTPTPAPTATPEPACELGIAWWQVEIQDDWTFFAGAARTELLTPTTADQYTATLEAMRLRRAGIENAFTPPCYFDARDALLRAADGMIASVQALLNGDAAGAENTATVATTDLGLVLTALWDQGVVTSADAPTAAGVVRGGGGAECPITEWYAQAQVSLVAFNDALTAYRAAAGGAVMSQQMQIGGIAALAGNFDVITAAGCTVPLQTLATGFIDAASAGLGQFSGGQPSEGRAVIAGMWAQKALFDAWLAWLGQPAI